MTIPFIRLANFVRESNVIEGIYKAGIKSELDATVQFLTLPELNVLNLETLVKAYQPDAILRNISGLDVRVGSYIAPRGGVSIAIDLDNLLTRINKKLTPAYEAHIRYETLHPFTDGNGRSGRAVWLWQMNREGFQLDIGFLHWWYYATLQHSRI